MAPGFSTQESLPVIGREGVERRHDHGIDIRAGNHLLEVGGDPAARGERGRLRGAGRIKVAREHEPGVREPRERGRAPLSDESASYHSKVERRGSCGGHEGSASADAAPIINTKSPQSRRHTPRAAAAAAAAIEASESQNSAWSPVGAMKSSSTRESPAGTSIQARPSGDRRRAA